MAMIAFSRAIGPVAVDCILEENHTSEIEVTEIPVETGARITDHAIVLPKRLSLEVADANAAATFNALVRLQESRAPFSIVTGFTIYRNMLITSINAKRDAKTSKILRCTAELQEIIIVATAYAADSGDGSKSKSGQPGGKKSTRAASASPERSGDAKTADRASGTVHRGDAATTSVPVDRSAIKSLLRPNS